MQLFRKLGLEWLGGISDREHVAVSFTPGRICYFCDDVVEFLAIGTDTEIAGNWIVLQPEITPVGQQENLA